MSNTKYNFDLNKNLYLKDPMATAVGREIITAGAPLFLQEGLESVTLKKLAQKANTTEATVYKYFKNKHRLLQYYFQLYWTWLEQQIKVFTAISERPQDRVLGAVKVICKMPDVAADPGFVEKDTLRELVIAEGSKAYMHVQVDEDNEKKLFAPYKSLAKYLGDMIAEWNPDYPFPVALATTVLEMSHSLRYYMHHLPSLTDFSETKDHDKIVEYINSLITKTLSN